MKISFANNIFFLQSDGSIYWPKNKTLILGDLHLEKSSFYAKEGGNFLPPYDSLETLFRLKKKLHGLLIKKILLLGDIFHDAKGYDRMETLSKNELISICNNYEVIWVIGNHDGLLKPKNVKLKFEYKCENISFIHKTKNKKNIEISGHYHPKAYFKINGKKTSRPCFIKNDKKIILPAFGSFTGGLNISSSVFKTIFNKNFEVFILAGNDVFLIN